MIKVSSIDKLKEKLRLEHPVWDSNALDNYANELIATCSNELEEVIEKYISSDEETDYSHGEFSIFLIRAMRNNCGFIDAVTLMDAYLKDAFHGKALITRR